jgi:hypothetical protein
VEKDGRAAIKRLSPANLYPTNSCRGAHALRSVRNDLYDEINLIVSLVPSAVENEESDIVLTTLQKVRIKTAQIVDVEPIAGVKAKVSMI